MMRKQALFLFGALFLCASVHAAGNAAEGQKKSTACAACHGPDGNTPVIPDAPKLAGQHKDYLYKVLAEYKSGTRKNAIMLGQVTALSRQDLQDLAAYYLLVAQRIAAHRADQPLEERRPLETALAAGSTARRPQDLRLMQAR